MMRRAAVETLDSLVRGGLDSDAASVRDGWEEPEYRLARRFEGLPGEEREALRAGRARALDLVLAVRRVRGVRLGEAAASEWSFDGAGVRRRKRGWQARLSLLVRRFGRLARVLAAVCQGESLELACTGAGFGFSGRRSRGFELALDQTGVRAALCVATGHGAGVRGSVGHDLARASV